MQYPHANRGRGASGNDPDMVTNTADGFGQKFGSYRNNNQKIERGGNSGRGTRGATAESFYTPALRGVGIPRGNFQQSSGNTVAETCQNLERAGAFIGSQGRGQVAQERPPIYGRQKYLEPYDESAQAMEKSVIQKEIVEDSVPSYKGNSQSVALRGMNIPRGNIQQNFGNAVNEIGQNSERGGTFDGSQGRGGITQRRPAIYSGIKYNDEPVQTMKQSDIPKEIVEHSVPSYQGNLQPSMGTKQTMKTNDSYRIGSGQVSGDHSGEQKSQDLGGVVTGLLSQLTLCSSDNKREIAAVSASFHQSFTALNELIQKMCR